MKGSPALCYVHSMSKGRAIVAMNGGVDSSVAALLLQQEGCNGHRRHDAPLNRRAGRRAASEQEVLLGGRRRGCAPQPVPGRPAPAAQGDRRPEGPVLRALHPHADRVGTPPPANRRVPQGDCPMDRRRGRAARGRQARQPGDMLHLGRRLPEIRRRQNARGSGGT